MKVFSEAFKNIWRDKGISFAALLVTTLTFFVTSVVVLAVLASGLALNYIESKAQLTAFFKDEASEQDILKLKSQLEALPGVLEVDYTSKEQAMAIYKEEYKNEPSLLESITANIFPASLDVRTQKIADLEGINRMLKNNKLVEEVVYFEDVAQNFKRVSQMVKQAGLVLMGVLISISLLIILLAIGMSIHGKKDEIEIMRLVGAGVWYIRAPFLIQGAFYCLAAVLISFLMILGAVPVIYPKVAGFFNGIPLPEITPILAAELVFGELLGASLLGAIGAGLAIHKYLRT